MEFPEALQGLMALAVMEAVGAQAEAVEPLHLFIAVCKEDSSPVVEAMRVNRIDNTKLRRRVRAFAHDAAVKVEGGPHRISGRVFRILARAQHLAEERRQSMDIRHVAMALFETPDADLQRVIEKEKFPAERLIERLKRNMQEAKAVEQKPAEVNKAPQPINRPATLALDSCGKDYTALARAGRLSPVIGRKEEIKQVVRVLLRKQKNNPVLIGDAGVGKTSVVEGLALRAASDDAPAEIRNLRIVEVMLSAIVAGTKYRGEFEEHLMKIVEEAESDPNLVIFLDEIHTLVGAGSAKGALDAANILKPALARGLIRCIGATTPGEYANYIEKDSALERRFQPVRIDEPTPDETLEILRGLRGSYESHHNVEITEEAIEAAVALSVRYLPDRRLPDKACDLIDQAAVTKRILTISPGRAANLDQNRVVREDIAQAVSAWTGIPVERLTVNETERLLQMESVLRRRVVGQDHAIEAVAQVVRTALAGLSRPERPYGVFLFLGPTGVGKTELAKALAEFLFGDEKQLVRFDMSEYMEEHSVSKLIGSPPGYIGHEEGGRLTDSVRRSPYCVILFDEIEKAHPKVFDLFLQIFDEGRLTDSQGRRADFRNTIIIMTSNIDVDSLSDEARIGFRLTDADPEAKEEASQERIRKALQSHFRPELINRIDRIIPYRRLGQTQIRSIIDKTLSRVRERLSEKKIELRISSEVYDALMQEGYKPDCGACEMERVIERQIVQPLANGLLEGRFKSGSRVQAVCDGGGIIFRN